MSSKRKKNTIPTNVALASGGRESFGRHSDGIRIVFIHRTRARGHFRKMCKRYIYIYNSDHKTAMMAVATFSNRQSFFKLSAAACVCDGHRGVYSRAYSSATVIIKMLRMI